MPEYSPRLNIEKALGAENVNRAYFMRVIDKIDEKAATIGPDGKLTESQQPTLKDASTTQKGVVQLNDNTNSPSTTQAATANAVKKANDNANNRYTKPGAGIPKTDLTAAVQASLNKADTAVQDVSGLATKEEVAAHSVDDMPHQFVAPDNKKCRYGFKTNAAMDGLIFVYEEVL